MSLYQRHLFWGGYPDSERNICFFPAGWQEEDALCSDPEGEEDGGRVPQDHHLAQVRPGQKDISHA